MSRKLENAMNLYLEGIRDGHYTEAVNKYTGDRYTQHSTGVRDGKEGFIEFFGPFVERNPHRDIQLVRKLEDGKNVFVQAYQNINKGEARWVTTDFFDTDEQERIIEHWDVIAPYCDKTASGRTSVDGAAEIENLDKTDENKALVRSFISDVFMSGGSGENLDRYISRKQYFEHNIDRKDGFEALSVLVKSPERKMEYKEIVHLLGQGNFVATLSRVLLSEGDSQQELCHADIFRIENGLIVEHWDNSEAVPAEDVNSGKF